MRTIKFRGKSIDTDEWFFGTLFIRPAPPTCLGKRKEDKCYIQFSDPRYTPDWNMPYRMVQGEVEPKTVGQFTGLHDKTEKEIYEGDILKFSDVDTAIVEWNEKYASFIVKPIQDYYFDSEILGHAIEYSNVEVIGNIYDNKNLSEE